MGTRADFYVGKGPKAEWIGSVALDGDVYAEDPKHPIMTAQSEGEFREAVASELAQKKSATLPERGWPWPWETSAMTDYTYWFEGHKVHYTTWGVGWDEFPDMTSVQNVTFGDRSGLIIMRTD